MKKILKIILVCLIIVFSSLLTSCNDKPTVNINGIDVDSSIVKIDTLYESIANQPIQEVYFDNNTKIYYIYNYDWDIDDMNRKYVLTNTAITVIKPDGESITTSLSN